MSDLGSVSQWLVDVKRGDDQAMAKLVQRYWEELVGLARQRLRGAPFMRDEEDVVNRAFLDFHTAIQQKRVPELEHRHQLLALLSHIVICKSCNQIEHEQAGRRGGGMARSPQALISLADNDAYAPMQQALLKDFYTSVVSALPEDLQAVGELFLGGYTHAEMAKHLGVAERTVDRKVALLKQLLKNLGGRLLEAASASM
jgi:DNA-directed RNA polymerase specialized sigma24 family protein